jgi:23S rRNA (uracil1939-C5)-methyltransferase
VNSTTTDVSFGDTMEVISGSGYIEEFINGFRYRITPNAFFQTNSHAAALLQKTVLEFVGDASGKKILDLYCGSGFFGIALGKGGAVMGVESVPDAIRDAKMNAELNNIGIEFHEAKTESFDWGTLHPDVLILDPPRMGMHDNALADVLKNKPPRIVYISCNYKNFARELVLLKEHYGVAAMRAIDMFPHTPHVELITCLVRR